VIAGKSIKNTHRLMFISARYTFSTACRKGTLGEQITALTILNQDASWVWVVKITPSASPP